MKKYIFLVIWLSFFSGNAQDRNVNGFYENKGQIVDQNNQPNVAVKYLLNTKSLNVQLRKSGFSYDVYESIVSSENKNKKPISAGLVSAHKKDFLQTTTQYTFHRIDIDFLNTNENISIVAEAPIKAYSNYYPSGKSEGFSNVRAFQKVTYKELYPNIDVVFTIPDDISKATEYNFIVRPGGKISDIQMKFSGADTKLSENKIKMNVRFGELQEQLPASWIEENGSKLDIAVRYKKILPNVYGFDAAGQNIFSKTIIIDPVPVRLWGTYFGGSGGDSVNDMCLDDNQDLYISGGTSSSTGIATAGSYQSEMIGGGDGYFAKFDPNGVLQWCTYFPVSGGIHVDSAHNIIIYGTAWQQPNFTTPGAHQTVQGNYTDAYLIKLDALGFREWATYYGGNQNEDIFSVSTDASNNIYVVGETNSTDVFSTAGAYQEENASSAGDAFIAKFSTTGVRIWGTFYGGTASDAFFCCKVSSDNFLYLAGGTNSSSNIATPGTYMPTGTSGGMFVKFDLNGNRIWGTYLGEDQMAVRMAINGNIAYFSGKTTSHTGIGTPGTFNENFVSGMDAINSPNQNTYFMKFDIQSQTKVWGTYFFDQVTGIALNNNDELYFCGETPSDVGVTTPDAYMPTKGFYHKTFMIKLDSSGQRQWGTYYGGEKAEQMPSIAVDNSGSVYLAGNTNGSTTGIATAGAHDTTLGSNPDGFIAKFKDCFSATITTSNSPVCTGTNLQLSASGGTGYNWSGPDGFVSTLQNPVILNATAVKAGVYSCIVTGTGGCDSTNNTTVVVGDTVLPIPDVLSLPTLTNNCSLTVTSTPTATDHCSGAITGTTTNLLTYTLPGTYTIQWNYTDTNGNTATQNQTVVIHPNTDPVATQINYTECDDNTDGKQDFNLTSKESAIINQPNFTFTYYKDRNDALTPTNPILNPVQFQNDTNPQTIYVRVLNTVTGCASLSEMKLIVAPKPTISNTVLAKCDTNNNGKQYFDLTQSFGKITTHPNDFTFEIYDSMINLNASVQIPSFTNYENTSNPQIIYVKAFENGCFNIAEVQLTVNAVQDFVLSDLVECDDDYDGKTAFAMDDKTAEMLALLPPDTYSYTFHHSRQEAIDNVNSFVSPYDNALQSETIFIRATGSICPTIFELQLIVLEKPLLTMKTDWAICDGKAATLTADPGFDQYEWSNGAQTQSTVISQDGNYTIKVTNFFGGYSCSDQKTINVTPSNVAKITGIETQDWSEGDNVITIMINGIGIYEYSIDGVNYQTFNQFSGLPNGIYTVYVKDKNDCGIATKEVFLLMYSRFFTPNGDGFNDKWNIDFSVLEPGLDIQIMDRYGKFITRLTHNSPGWDGTLNGSPLPADDYWFVATRANGTQHRGHFSLKR